jgi:hypothetical protein
VYIPLVVTVGLAFVGYFATYANNIILARRKDRLDRVNMQLRGLYGPLYAIDRATNTAWIAFRSRYKPRGAYFDDADPPSLDELEAWRVWMAEVFMPMNLLMEKAIIENADLIIENEMPKSFIDLIAHVAAYKPVMKKWEEGDFSEHLSFSEYPRDRLSDYVERSYVALKNERAELLGRLKKRTRGRI